MSLGAILFKYENDNKLFEGIKDNKISRSCFSRFCNPLLAGYISTIGVIDELRKIGIGKILLEKAVSLMKNKN